MRLQLFSVVLAVAAVLCLLQNGEAAPPSHVVVMDNSNAAGVIDGQRHVFVKFYAPWCGHCKDMAPAWDALASAFAEEDSVVIAKVDATKETDLSSKFEIPGYPTLLYFPKGSTLTSTPEKIVSMRDPESLLKYVNKEAGTFRRLDGTLEPATGIVKEIQDDLDGFKCKGTQEECKAKLLKVLEEAVENVSGDHPKDSLLDKATNYYGSAVQKIKNSASYIADEKARLESLSKSSDLTADAKMFSRVRINVLSSIEAALNKIVGQEEL